MATDPDARRPRHGGNEPSASTNEVVAESSRRVMASRQLIAELDDRLRVSQRLTRDGSAGRRR